ncbi:GntR family transcriptional regulator [Actinomycetaceae bacterium MB13-C1-2]|nr:GntR family transcriptional regulator [Actinomycetaceae bacterium MB13-C1-2]
MDSDRPLFVQIAEAIENQIVSGALLEESMAPSTNALATFYRINPATAAKGMRLLQDQGIVERRRGLGMFVTKGARKKLLAKRRTSINEEYVKPLVMEARVIGLHTDELIEMVEAEASSLSTDAGSGKTDADRLPTSVGMLPKVEASTKHGPAVIPGSSHRPTEDTGTPEITQRSGSEEAR